MNHDQLSEPDPHAAAVRCFTDGSKPIFDRLSEHRERIDAIDLTIIELLAERSKIVRDAARFKKDIIAAPALGRQAAQYLRIRELADAQHSPLTGFTDLVETTYRTLIPGFVALQIDSLIKNTELLPRDGK